MAAHIKKKVIPKARVTARTSQNEFDDRANSSDETERTGREVASAPVKNPLVTGGVVYEINARVWLAEMGRDQGREPLTLDEVADEVLDSIAARSVDCVWLMGVWMRSDRAIDHARQHEGLRVEYEKTLADFDADEDVTGSPYAIWDYVPEPWIAKEGFEELARFRRRLQDRGMKLILDFVPNHMALDNKWISENPELFIEVPNGGASWFEYEIEKGKILKVANGKDPYFPDGWTDTAQLNYFNPATREKMSQVLETLARVCDGVRCDMAMLVVNEVFEQTWGYLVQRPAEMGEFWPEVVKRARQVNSEFVFIGEVYWDMGQVMRGLGFDWVYDKNLYDALCDGHPRDVHNELLRVAFGAQNQEQKGVRFIENHDEPRAAGRMGVEKSRAAAAVAMFVPGLFLLHEGQMEGKSIKFPVQLGRWPKEPVNEELVRYYQHLLGERRLVVGSGEWVLHSVGTGLVDHQAQMVVQEWRDVANAAVVVVNMTADRASGFVPVQSGWEVEVVDDWVAGKVLDHAPVEHERLFVDLAPWAVQKVSLVKR